MSDQDCKHFPHDTIIYKPQLGVKQSVVMCARCGKILKHGEVTPISEEKPNEAK